MTSSSLSMGWPWAEERPRYASPMVVARVKGMENQTSPPVMNPHTPCQHHN